MTGHGVRRQLGALSVALVLGTAAAPAAAVDIGNWRVSGWVRQYLSWNMEDVGETAGHDDAWDLAMNRRSLFLDIFGTTGPLRWTGRFRFDHETLTDYEERLEDLTAVTGGGRADFSDEYNRGDVRELFFDWDITERISFRFGRQQVVWGETDFFHATDVIHGFDLTWRKFLVPENEDTRKPLIIANAMIRIPELNGELQVLVRPGIDDHDWIGNTIPTFGGRWSNTAAKGFNFVSQQQGGLATFNTHHREGDADDPHYGFRWNGSLGVNQDINYSINYYHGQHGFFADPVLLLDPLNTNNPSGLEFIYPETDTVGMSVTGFIAPWNMVYRAEFAYNWDRVFTSLVPRTNPALGFPLPFQIVEKDAWNFVLGADFSPRLMDVIGTSNASLLTFQMFDWFIPGANQSDRLIRFDGSGTFDKHNIIGTAIFSNPFLNDTLNFTIVGLVDLTEGGGMIIPSVQYDWGRHWRVKLEADFALGGNTTTPFQEGGAGFPPDEASVFGALRDDDQLLLRITYQF